MITNIICSIIGKTGSGKSTFLNKLLKEDFRRKRREGIVVLDLRGDHLNLIKECDFHYLSFFEEYLDLKIDYVKLIKKNKFLIIEPIKISREGYEILSDLIAGAVLEVGNRIFVLEEASLSAPVYQSIRKNLSILATTGRKLGIDFYFTTQRPSLVNTTIISQANVRVSFALDDKNDLNRVKSYFNSSEDLNNLKRFEFLIKNEFNHKEAKSDTNKVEEIFDIIYSI